MRAVESQAIFGRPLLGRACEPRLSLLVFVCSLQFRVIPGKEGTMVFTGGKENKVYRAPNGQLIVVSPRLVATKGGGGRGKKTVLYFQQENHFFKCLNPKDVTQAEVLMKAAPDPTSAGRGSSRNYLRMKERHVYRSPGRL